MDSPPETPDQHTRTAVTRRIIAHVTRGWPGLGEPIVRHRGRFCDAAAVPPGHREPTPILRLRYQGSADRWAIGIYLASNGHYTESELPTSFGPKTGTPEQGVDDTFILYAGPKTGHLPPGGHMTGIGERYLPASILVIAITDDPAADGGLMSERDVLASDLTPSGDGRAPMFARLAAHVRPVLANRVPGVLAATADGAPMAVMAFTVAAGRIVEIDSIADPRRLAALNLRCED